MKVTSALLRRKGACRDQTDKFVALFPKGIEITEALCVQHAQVFNWDWAAENLLPKAARVEYERVKASAWAEYDRVMASAWAEYDRVTAPAWAQYKRVKASALAEYNRVTASAWTEYERVRASTFGKLAEVKHD